MSSARFQDVLSFQQGHPLWPKHTLQLFLGLWGESIVGDITERKRAEEAYRAVVQQGLAILQDNRIVFASKLSSK